MQLSRTAPAPGPPRGPSEAGLLPWCHTICGPAGCSSGGLSRFAGTRRQGRSCAQSVWGREGGLGCGWQGPCRSRRGARRERRLRLRTGTGGPPGTGSEQGKELGTSVSP